MQFTYNGYKNLLELLICNGYKIVDYDEYHDYLSKTSMGSGSGSGSNHFFGFGGVLISTIATVVFLNYFARNISFFPFII